MEKNKEIRAFFINTRDKSFGDIVISDEKHIKELLNNEPIMTEKIKLSYNKGFVFLDVLYTEKDTVNKIPSGYVLGYDTENKNHAFFTGSLIITFYEEGNSKYRMRSLSDMETDTLIRHILRSEDKNPYLLMDNVNP